MGTTIHKLPWSSILAIHHQNKHGRACLLHPKQPWDSSPQATMSNSTQASMRLNISSYHEYLNSSLLEIYYPKLPLELNISRYHEIQHLKLSLEFTYQAIFRCTIWSYHYIHIWSYLSFDSSHQLYHTWSAHTIHLQSTLVRYVSIHFRSLGKRRIHLCKITCFSRSCSWLSEEEKLILITL